jgi:hypothetical protein
MSDLKDSFWGCIILLVLSLLFAAIVFPLVWLRSTFIFRPVLFLAYPFMVVLAWNGYPLAYYKISGRQFIRPRPDNVYTKVPQSHEYFMMGAEPTPVEKRALRLQRLFRLIFLLVIIVISEARLNGLGTSWRKIFLESDY